PTSRPIPSSISPVRGLAPSRSRSTRAIAPSRSPTSLAARAPRCWPARRRSAASTSCRSWPTSSPTLWIGSRPSSPSARRQNRRQGRCRRPSSIAGACRSTACCRARAPCNIFTTSGTTSTPKFVLHRQGAIAGHAQQVARSFGFTTPETLSLAILPMCGVFGFNQTLATLAAGKPSVLVESYEIEEIARLITEHKPTTMFGSDDMYQRLMELMPGRWPFRSIKWAGYAAFNASLEDLPERAQPRGLRLVGLYGMSEVQALYARQPLNVPVSRRKQGGGVPVSPFAHIRVRDPETGELLGPGQPGMLEM